SAYCYVESYIHLLRKQLLLNQYNSAANEEFQIIRDNIHSFYELKVPIEIVFGSSGTDLELVVLALSLSSQNKAHNIVLGANEVGSGIENAARGRFFSDLTPLGKICNQGESVPGFSDDRISFSNVEIRESSGEI